MSKEEAKEAASLVAGLARLASIAKAVPSQLLEAWLVYDAGLSKTQAKLVVESISRLTQVLQKEA